MSIGDYVLSGGELPALVLIDAVVRLLPGALGDAESASRIVHDGLLDWPHYTRPEVLEGRPVPPVLLGGNHAAIGRWRRQQALGRTWLRRPGLLGERELTPRSGAARGISWRSRMRRGLRQGNSNCEMGENMSNIIAGSKPSA